MNLKENIRKVLREETNDRMVNLVRDSIDKIGLDFTLKVFGGYDVVAEYGDIITKKEKIQYIVNVCKGLGGGITLNGIIDGGKWPIPYNETKTEYSEIAHIGEFGVYVDVWGGYNNQNLIREDKVNYDKLNNKILDDVFRVSLDIAYHNGIKLEENYTPWVKRKVLREETFKDDVKKMILDDGVKDTMILFGGFDNLVKVLGYDDVSKYIYQYLNENSYPDYGWSDHVYYREQVGRHGSSAFYIDDMLTFDYTKYGNGYKKLEVYPWMYNKLDDIFENYDWESVVREWFQDNTGLKVDMVE